VRAAGKRAEHGDAGRFVRRLCQDPAALDNVVSAASTVDPAGRATGDDRLRLVPRQPLVRMALAGTGFSSMSAATTRCRTPIW
jgi:hypothetical protein